MQEVLENWQAKHSDVLVSPMRKPPYVSRRDSPANVFRKEIEKAEAEGVSRDQLVLQLTNSDVSHLKRDASLAVTDISFADGVMRFLGVRVEEGAVSKSAIQRL